jgi:diguanylate cyclase (GGDEF)-like protein
VMIDIDNFKRLNDTLGHLEGDRVLKNVANIIKTSVPDDAIAARYGGEEFALILPGKKESEGEKIAEQVRTRIEHAKEVTVSLGLSVFPKDAGTQHNIIDYADRALYKSKASGRNRLTKWSESGIVVENETQGGG